jgi:hypothetical protein
MDIETVSDLRIALNEIGYSNKAIAEIMNWYTTDRPSMN